MLAGKCSIVAHTPADQVVMGSVSHHGGNEKKTIRNRILKKKEKATFHNF